MDTLDRCPLGAEDEHFPASFRCDPRVRVSRWARPRGSVRSIAEKLADCRTDVGGRRVGGAGSARAWHQLAEPGIWLASALPGGKTWELQADDEIAAGSRKPRVCRRLRQWSACLPTSRNHNRARFTSNCGRHRCGSKATPIQRWCACCWSAYGDDGAADRHAEFGLPRELTDLRRGFTRGIQCAGEE